MANERGGMERGGEMRKWVGCVRGRSGRDASRRRFGRALTTHFTCADRKPFIYLFVYLFTSLCSRRGISPCVLSALFLKRLRVTARKGATHCSLSFVVSA